MKQMLPEMKHIILINMNVKLTFCKVVIHGNRFEGGGSLGSSSSTDPF